MKKLLLIICLLFSIVIQAQTKYPPIDKSPLDVSYCPANFPLLKIQEKTTEPLMARVLYSRPQKNGRIIFGDLISYDKVWRLGANESTEIEFFQNVTINNVKIKKGRYSLLAIPSEKKWTIIINRETDTWGGFRYDEKKDVVRMDIPVSKSEINENFSMMFSKSDNKIFLMIAWDEVQVSLPIIF